MVLKFFESCLRPLAFHCCPAVNPNTVVQSYYQCRKIQLRRQRIYIYIPPKQNIFHKRFIEATNQNDAVKFITADGSLFPCLPPFLTLSVTDSIKLSVSNKIAAKFLNKRRNVIFTSSTRSLKTITSQSSPSSSP